jgi:predicted SAM-dependent methyltransferase
MARCGRCGLFLKYPDDHPEKKWSGTCMWYQMQLADDDVWAERKCKDFFERLPGFHAMDHFDYKVKRDNLGDAYVVAKRAKILAYVSLALSLIGVGFKLFSP